MDCVSMITKELIENYKKYQRREFEMATPKVEPQVGMGVTFGAGSDRYPGTISRVSPSGKTFWYKRDDFTRTDSNGFSEDQTYNITPNPNGAEHRVSLTKRGWREVGGGSVGVGFRRAYQDPHF